MPRWRFDDPVTDEFYEFEVNPREGGSPPRKKNVDQVNTTAPGGAVLVFEGQDDTPVVSFSGMVRSEEQYEALLTWFGKRYPITYTDDLGRTFTVYVTSFEPKRERSATAPWRHSYTVTCLVLGESA